MHGSRSPGPRRPSRFGYFVDLVSNEVEDRGPRVLKTIIGPPQNQTLKSCASGTHISVYAYIWIMRMSTTFTWWSRFSWQFWIIHQWNFGFLYIRKWSKESMLLCVGIPFYFGDGSILHFDQPNSSSYKRCLKGWLSHPSKPWVDRKSISPKWTRLVIHSIESWSGGNSFRERERESRFMHKIWHEHIIIV